MAYRSQTQPLCRYCGKRIGKAAKPIFVRDPRDNNTAPIRSDEVQGHLYCKADCQRHTNHQVISVQYWHRGADGRRRVMSFGTWDGESYADEFFCSGPCRERFAYLFAATGHYTKGYNDALRLQREKIDAKVPNTLPR